MALITALAQVGQVISSRPQPPRFHDGGVVQGRSGQEVSAVLMAGEKVTTQRQFDNIMQSFANMANMKSGGGSVTVQPNVIIQNTASNAVSVSTSHDPSGLIIKVVEKAMADGRLDNGFAMQNLNSLGAEFTV